MEAVHRYEGTVNQVMGDGIMALFGAPLAHEDHAVRACYAALRMQDAIRRYTEDVRKTHGAEVQIRVGMNSGDVVVRSVGSDLRMDYTAVGQTTHLAARMEQLAPPGATRLTAETLRLAEEFVQVRPLGPIPVKGVATPVEVFELTGAAAVRTRFQAARARGFTRFVGRDAEMDQIRQAAAQARQGQGQLVAVVGEAGVGKSRLFYEFIHSHHVLGASDRAWRVLEASSVSYGKATPFLPLADLLRGYFRIDDRDDARSVRAKVTGTLLTLDRALEDAVPAMLWILEAIEPDDTFLAREPVQRRRRAVESVRRVLLRESQRAAAPPRLRRPSLDRHGDAGRARQPGRESGHRARSARRELPSGVPPRLGQQDLLSPAPHRSAAAGERGRSCSGRSSAPIHPPRRSRRSSSRGRRATPSSSRRACGPSSRRAPSPGNRARTGSLARRRRSRCRRRSRPSWPRASIACAPS